jgi:hypothetical protein
MFSETFSLNCANILSKSAWLSPVGSSYGTTKRVDFWGRVHLITEKHRTDVDVSFR